MIPYAGGGKVFLALGYVDMRKAANGLAQLVAGKFSLDPFSGNVFAFCNKRRDLIKILVWDSNGFWLLQKKLEKQHFRWPRSESEVMEMDYRKLGWLLDGLDPSQLEGHKKLEYSTIY